MFATHSVNLVEPRCVNANAGEPTRDKARDLTLAVDNLSTVSGLRIVSSDGRNHALRVISPSGTVNLGGTTTGDPNIAAQISVGGSLMINGTTSLYGQLLAKSIVTASAVTVNYRPLFTAGISVG